MLKLEAWIEDDTAEKSQEAEFVVIVDRSGSMQGTPWKQVQQALIKMLELTKTDANIKVKSIAYNHGSSFLNLTGDTGVDAKTINGIRATGSTNFVAVFNELSQMFKDKKQDPSKPCFIFFMTDGEDTCNDEKQLMVGKEKLQTDIEHFGGSVVFHVLGFSESHNEEFLESLSFLGTSDGTYSFVSPREGEKALEERIVSLIKSISSFVGRNINIEIVGENLEFQGENPEVTKSEIVLPAVMSKKDGKIQISTKKFVRVKDGSEPKFTLKLHDGKSKDEKTATLKNVETEVMEKKEDILDHNLVKMRTAMNQLITNTEEDNTNKEEVKKKYEEIEKSFKKLKIDESAPKATEKRMKAVQTGLNLLKDMYDPSYVSVKNVHTCINLSIFIYQGMYSERERNLKKKAGYSEFQMLTA